MPTLTFPIDDKRLQELEQAAAAQGMLLEALVRRSIEEYVNRRRDFLASAGQVLAKNQELYRRLAQ